MFMLTEDFDEIMPEDETELIKEVNRYNKYMSDMMTFQGVDGWYNLFINSVMITNGDIYDVVDRVKQINRENGLNHLGG